LLLTFIVCSVLGLLLVFTINTGTNISLPFRPLYWHVEAGIAFAVIGVFHALWHLKYYLKILK